MEFREPALLLLALLAVPVFFGSRLATGRLRFSALSLLPGRGQMRTWRAMLSWVPDALLAVATILFAVAVAGPREVGGETRSEREGIAIVMAVDTSSSMGALDLSAPGEEETRLDVVKQVFERFVRGDGDGDDGLEGRPDDTIGLVSFAGYADSLCPLTLDHGTLLGAANDLELVTERSEDGTAIGDALGLAVERLRQSEARSKVVILLTDGVNTAGEDAPLEAARLAQTLGIKVYTIGAGTNGVAAVRVTDPFSGRSVLRQTRVEIDEATLQEIADVTGGRYFRATDGERLEEVYAAIDRLEKTKVIEERRIEYEEKYAPFGAAAVIVACFGWLFGATVFRRLP